MNLEEIKKLMTQVGPEHIDNVNLVVRKYSKNKLYSSLVFCSVSGIYHDDANEVITHIIDLSTLTTKKLAVELAKECWSNYDIPFNDLIKYNSSSL